MTYKVLGLIRGVYSNKKDGSPVRYTRLYCSYDLKELRSPSCCDFDGIGTDTLFIKGHLDDVRVGDCIMAVYNKFGTCVDIIIKERSQGK